MAEQVEAAKSALKNEGVNANCLAYEGFEYECTFDVFSEIALTVIYHPTGCGCAFTIQVVTPRPRDDSVSSLVSVNAAYSTEVTRFSIVVYDYVADQVQEEIPEFADMTLDQAVKDTIESQVAADPNGDFQSITAGFAGVVKSFPKLPATLNKNDPANANYIPAIRFSIAQKYKSGAMFKVPCDLKMHTTPNAWESQCVPYRPEDHNQVSKKRMVDAVTDNAWVRTYYLFPKQESTCGVSGYTPMSRYIVSLYNTNICKPSSGYFSIDTEFRSKFIGSEALVGAWRWEREFEESRIVFGTPLKFSSLTSVWCLGYSQITWHSASNFEATDVPLTKGVCSSLPVTNGKANGDWTPEDQSFKYKESHLSYPAKHSGVNCAPLQLTCEKDATLLAFQNDDPRDFLKYDTSTMVTGPRTRFCSDHGQDGASVVEFDTMVYRGVLPNDQLEKRSTLRADFPSPANMHMVVDPDTGFMRHGRHAPHLVRAYNEDARKRAVETMANDPLVGAPHRDNFALNAAAGSVDINGENGASAGDHPLRKFPETYSAPLTLDPSQQETEPLVYDGQLVNGVPPKFCDIGDVGCTCREDSSCNFPYECGSLGYCQRKACEHGQPGCPVHSDGTCEAKGVDGALLVASNGYCVYQQPEACAGANAGSVGCSCVDSCSEGLTCTDNFCTKPSMDAQLCSDGEAGCQCTDEGACSGGAQCHPFSGLCVFLPCTRGTPGCNAQLNGQPCSPGFVADDNGMCVEASCVPGSAGCKCTGSKACLKKGYRCLNLDRNGEIDLCVGVDLCAGGQEQRCIDECGSATNVASCPQCSYSTPICKDERLQVCNPKSYLYGIEPCELDDSAATSLLLSLSALVAAFVTLF